MALIPNLYYAAKTPRYPVKYVGMYMRGGYGIE